MRTFPPQATPTATGYTKDPSGGEVKGRAAARNTGSCSERRDTQRRDTHEPPREQTRTHKKKSEPSVYIHTPMHIERLVLDLWVSLCTFSRQHFFYVSLPPSEPSGTFKSPHTINQCHITEALEWHPETKLPHYTFSIAAGLSNLNTLLHRL